MKSTIMTRLWVTTLACMCISSWALAGSTEYLVIYADGLASPAQQLCTHRSNANQNCYGSYSLACEAVSVRVIDATVGNNDQLITAAEVAQYISDKLQTDPVEYVVLFGHEWGLNGEPSPLTHIPKPPSGYDAAYTDIDHDDMPEASLGRIPAETLSDAVAIVAKIQVHDNTRWDLLSQRWRNNVLYTGYDLDHVGHGHGSVVDGYPIVEFGTMLSETGLSGTLRMCGSPAFGFASSLSTLSEREAFVIEKLNQGTGLWIGMGSYSKPWSLVEFMTSTSSLVPLLNDDNYPFLIAMSCEVGRGTTGDIVNKLLFASEKGIVGAIAPQGLVDPYLARLMTLVMIRQLQSDPLCVGDRSVGQVLREAQMEMAALGYFDPETVGRLRVLGDPAMRVPVRGDLLTIEEVRHWPPLPPTSYWTELQATIHDPSHGEPPYGNQHTYYWTTDKGRFTNQQKTIATVQPTVYWMCPGSTAECAQAGMANITVHVSDYELPCDADLAEHLVPFSPPGGPGSCPVLERNEQGVWRELNTILASCAYDSSCGLSFDYYRFAESPSPQINPLEFRIREISGDEMTEIDCLDLLMIDHSPQTSVSVTGTGHTFYNGAYCLPDSVLDGRGLDLTWLVQASDDGAAACVVAGDSLVVVFDDVVSTPTVGHVWVRAKEKPELAVAYRAASTGLVVSALGDTGRTVFYPRRDWSVLVADHPIVSRGDGIPETLCFRAWEEHEIDAIGIVEEGPTVASPPVSGVGTAIHSSMGNVTAAVATCDGTAITLDESQALLLSFPRPPLQFGQTRDLILRARGSYGSMQGKGTTALHQGPVSGIQSLWPNPSAGGVHILFACSGGSGVAISVFDVGGREIARASYPPMARGLHLSGWDAKDAAGRPVAAGVYFLELREGRQRDTRKILVMR